MEEATHPVGMDVEVYRAATKGNIDALRDFREPLPQILSPTKNTILHLYIMSLTRTHPNPTRVVQNFLDMCPPLLLQPNGNGETAFHIAARRGLVDIVILLIENVKAGQGDRDSEADQGALPMIRFMNKDADTALHEAIRFNHPDVVKIIIREDPEFTYPANKAGETPLYIAVDRGHRDLVSEIRRTCSSPNYQGPNGKTALHAAVIRNDERMVDDLLGLEASMIRARDNRGWTPLHLAALLGHTIIAELLMDHDKSIAYVCDVDKQTPLHLAASKGHVDIMKVLAYYCPDCSELVNWRGQNALHVAIQSRQHRIVDFVLKNSLLSNVLLNGKDEHGNTPLHQLAFSLYQSRDFVFIRDLPMWRSGSDLISDARVDKMAINNNNLNAFDIILANETFSVPEQDLKDLLKRNGARPSSDTVLQKDLKGVSSRNISKLGNQCEVGFVQEKEGNKEDTVLQKDLKGVSSRNISKLGNQCEVAFVQEKEGNKEDNRITKDVLEAHLVAAALIATVTFAAGITMPGGFQSEAGPNQGFAVLKANVAFKAFIITDTIAMVLSSCSVLMHLYLLMHEKHFKQYGHGMQKALLTMLTTTMFSLFAMVVAFVTGTYAVLGGHSSGLAIGICALGCCFFFASAYALLSQFSPVYRRLELDAYKMYKKMLAGKFYKMYKKMLARTKYFDYTH